MGRHCVKALISRWVAHCDLSFSITFQSDIFNCLPYFNSSLQNLLSLSVRFCTCFILLRIVLAHRQYHHKCYHFGSQKHTCKRCGNIFCHCLRQLAPGYCVHPTNNYLLGLLRFQSNTGSLFALHAPAHYCQRGPSKYFSMEALLLLKGITALERCPGLIQISPGTGPVPGLQS